MRIYRLLPALAFAALLGFSASGVQAGRFFGRANDGSNNTNQYPYGSQDSFSFGPAPQYQAQQPHVRHRLFHRDRGVASNGMPANAVSGYGMQPAYGAPYGYMQSPMMQSPAPMVQSPMQTAPFHTTSMAPAQVPVAPVVQSPGCRSCGQAAQAPMLVPSTPVMQSRLVPIPSPMPQGPTTAEPPTADVTGRAPF